MATRRKGRYSGSFTIKTYTTLIGGEHFPLEINISFSNWKESLLKRKMIEWGFSFVPKKRKKIPDRAIKSKYGI